MKNLVHKFFYRCAQDKRIYNRITNTEVKPKEIAKFYDKLIDSDSFCPRCIEEGLKKKGAEK